MEWDDPFFCSRIKLGPVTQVFFRPEEGHGASGITRVQSPFGQRNGHVSDYFFRLSFQYTPITDLDVDRFTAVQAGSIDLNLFPREKPADRQRFKGSLGEPFLLAINSDPELGGEIIKWCERDYEICIRI